MKKLKLLILASILFSSILPSFLHAQTEKVSRDEWLAQMKTEEIKIAAYVNEHMKNTAFNDSIKHAYQSSEKHDEVTESDLSNLTDKYLRDYYWNRYMELYPEAIKIYNPGRVQVEPIDADKPGQGITNILCKYGDFEGGLPYASGFAGYTSPTNYSTGLCSFVPLTNVAYNWVGFSNPNDFLVTNNIADPLVPSLNQTHNGSLHAVRINAPTPCTPGGGVNMLQKAFGSNVSGRVRINFSYALVMEDPNHNVRNPFFVARVLDAYGTEVARTCHTSQISDPFFQSTTITTCGRINSPAVWRDWACDYLEFDIVKQETYTIEFFVADCGRNGHFAYAYVDDICADVLCCRAEVDPPLNLKCKALEDGMGAKLSWNPVPGAAYYKLDLYANDPACCAENNPPYGFVSQWDVYNTEVVVPYSAFASCFSWSVAAVMEDSCLSDFSEKQCGCNLKAPPPDSLKCIPKDNGSHLFWDPVPGAAYYKVDLYAYDPECCYDDTYGYCSQWDVYGTDVFVPTAFAYCFSWTVITIMNDGTWSSNSEKKCSCIQPPPPEGLGCGRQDNNSSYLYWPAVPGATSYRVLKNFNDPYCCPNIFQPPVLDESFTTDNYVDMTPNTSCFSWWVIAIYPGGIESLPSEVLCSCSLDILGKPGKNENEQISATAVPNPASEYIEFEVNDKASQNKNSTFTLYLFDINGREVIKKDIRARDKLRLNIQPYPSGVYIYEVRSDNKILFKDKVVIEKH